MFRKINLVILLLVSFGASAHNNVVVVPLGGDEADLLKRTVFVTGEGNSAHNGSDLVSALNFVSSQSPSENDPWVIELESGEFDIGSNQLLLSNGMNIRGSGKYASKIISSSGAIAAVRVESSSSSISELTIEKRSGNGFVISANANSNFNISNAHLFTNGVTAISSGIPFSGSVGSGMLNIFGTTIELENDIDLRALDTRQTVVMDSSRIEGLESGTSGVIELFTGTVTISNSFIEDETNLKSGAGTLVCRGISAPSQFYTSSCP